ncbi:putative phosphodiesterase [Bradyrhizobium sp. LB1.3]
MFHSRKVDVAWARAPDLEPGKAPIYSLIDGGRRIDRFTAIRGNVDSGEWAHQYRDRKLVRLAGKSIYILHDL